MELAPQPEPLDWADRLGWGVVKRSFQGLVAEQEVYVARGREAQTVVLPVVPGPLLELLVELN